jgi:sugar lactone lactonase YvrE
VAGDGTMGVEGDGGLATSSMLNRPLYVAVDALGNIYINDASNNRIRMVTKSSGVITTVAGDGTQEYKGDGGLATSAGLHYPAGIAVDSSGNLYIADAIIDRVRMVTKSTGIITTVAGDGTQGGYKGDGGLATSAGLFYPAGIAVDSSGNLYIADTYNHRIRLVTQSTGIITTVAGNGTRGYRGDGGLATAAGLDTTYGVAVDASGNLYIADALSFRIRMVTKSTGIITTVAGDGSQVYSGDGGLATAAGVYYPNCVAVDASGNIYFADTPKHRIRMVTKSTGIITTVAGDGTQGYKGDGGLATSAGLYNPYGVAVDASGNLYIADPFNNRIRMVSFNGLPPVTPPPTLPPTTPPTTAPTMISPTPPPTLPPTTIPSGSFQPTAFTVTNCSLGTYVDTLGEIRDGCTICPIGEITGTELEKAYCGGCAMAFNEFEGDVTCSSCFAGQELEDNRSYRNTKCIDCKPGYYAYTPGDYSRYHRVPQAARENPGWPKQIVGEGEKCTECPPNTYSGPRAAECIACPPGTTNNAARTACVPASNPSPTHAPTIAPPAITLSECLPGQGYSADNCYDCPKGKYSSDGVVCLVCPRGTFSSVTRSIKCTQVQVGQVVNADSTGTITCQAGYYAPNPAGSALVEGYGDSYNKIERLKACTKCPPNMYATTGQDRCESCPKNTEVNVTLDGCTPCPRYYVRDYRMKACQVHIQR